MNKQQLLKLSAFIVTTIIFSASINAQIVYTDVIPDSTMYCTGNCTLNYNLDLNNDSNNDFILSVQRVDLYPPPCTETYSSITANPLNGNAVKDTLVGSTNYSIPLPFNAVIDSNLLLNQSWQTTGPQILENGLWVNPSCSVIDGGFGGLWDSLSDYYLGLRLLYSGQTFYGWVRLRVDETQPYTSVIIRDYAYNSIPNQPILAGQTTATGIAENSFVSSINFYPNPSNNHLTIALGSNNQKVEVSITDITGKIIYSSTSSETQKIEVNTQNFAAGTYIVQIHSREFIGTKKLVIEK